MSWGRYFRGILTGILLVIAYLLGKSCSGKAKYLGPVIIRDTIYIHVHDTIQTILTREIKPTIIIQSPETLTRIDTIWSWVKPGETPPLAYGVWVKGGEVIVGALTLELDSSGSALYHPTEWHFSRPIGEGWDWWAISKGDTACWAFYRRGRLFIRPYLGGELSYDNRGMSIYPAGGIKVNFGDIEGLVIATPRGIKLDVGWRF